MILVPLFDLKFPFEFAAGRVGTSNRRHSQDKASPMTSARRILIVDDDTELAGTLVEQLALHEEFEAEAVETAAKGMAIAKNGHIDLVIMDVGLPDIDRREAA